MSVRLAAEFESSDRWRRVAGMVRAALRRAGWAGWDVVLRPRGPADDGGPPAAADEGGHGLAVELDVADMHLGVGFPPGGTPIEDGDIGGLVVGLIAEAEDESADDYGPPDEDDAGDR